MIDGFDGFDLNTNSGLYGFLLNMSEETLAKLLVIAEQDVKRQCPEALFVRIADSSGKITQCAVCKLPLRLNARLQFATKAQFAPQIIGSVHEYIEDKCTDKFKMMVQFNAWLSAQRHLRALEQLN